MRIYKLLKKSMEYYFCLEYLYIFTLVLHVLKYSEAPNDLLVTKYLFIVTSLQANESDRKPATTRW